MSPANDGEAATIDDWLALADAYHDASVDAADGGVAIPLLWGTDAVHGHGNVIGATLFPHNIGLGATQNPALIREIGRATALEVLATGIDWTYAPTLAVAQDDRWGRTYEGYSEDPEIVAAYAEPEFLRSSEIDDQELVHDSPLFAYLSPGRFAAIERSNAFPFPANMKK